jgi:hypothetical protein
MNDTLAAQRPRRKAKPPTTWPAFALAAVAGVGAAVAYALRLDLPVADEAMGESLWRIFNASLLPTVIGALAIWCLLYFGFVRWKNGERGPVYFNSLVGLIFVTLMLTPFAQHQVQALRDGDVKGLNAELARVKAKTTAEQAAARAPLTAALTAAKPDLELTPENLVSPADRRAARARIAAARVASKSFHEGDTARAATARAAVVQAIAHHRVSAEVAQKALGAHDHAALMDAQRNVMFVEWEQALLDEADAGVDALGHAPWRVQGRNVMFASRTDADAFIKHFRQAAELRRKLERRVRASDLEVSGS